MNLILAALMQQVWAMEPAALERVVDVLTRRDSGVRLTAEQIEAAVGRAPQATEQRRSAANGGGVAVIPVFGTIAHRAHMVNQVSGSGGTSTELLGKVIRMAAADPNVASIVLDIDSPGGAVDGTPEVVDAIYEARAAKPIVAVANSLAASAGYWIGSAASEFVVTPSGTIGSIGVVAAHRHTVHADGASREVTEYITAGKYKAEGNSSGPLGDEARAHLQGMVDQAYGVMIRSIARNRGATPDAVRSQYGEGRVFSAQDALARGMVDRIATLDATIERMNNPRRRSRVKAAANELALAAAR
jgi:capsid assembly protease